MINCSHVPARWDMAQFEVYFDTIFLSENSRNFHLLHKNDVIVAKP